ncbi:hypothetical protein [Rhizobium sp. BK060]|uniref:hypothetical protein n=1 Tax=Rhizobium sp. BK060 TaxID=2587096 RepID=UPI001621E9AB|nr:hypothetical protein [Rhizobium sp. BK060]MBB3394185.1 hypothetical protein [Rhizobium sp. BK060]
MDHIVTSTLNANRAVIPSCSIAPNNDRPRDVDILLERSDNDHWVVTMISLRARNWAAHELCCALRSCFAGSMRLDIMSADRLLKNARKQGFKTEFVGLGGKDIF